MDAVYHGALRQLAPYERTAADWDVYEVPDPPPDLRALCGAALDLVAEWHRPFRAVRSGLHLKFYSRAGFAFAESLARLQGAPFAPFTVQRSWRAFVRDADPHTIWINAQLPVGLVLATLAHEACHTLQTGRGEALWAAREAHAETFARAFTAWYDTLEATEGAA